MRNRWNEEEAQKIAKDDLLMRVYTSRLLGRESDLVLHGGGNTSVKITEQNLFGEPEEILYVKGSGWDLGSIEAAGFAPVRQEVLLKMAQLEELGDMDMVKHQRAAMTNPYAPNPSVEAILHAIIPFKYVDHTHADAVVTITNTPSGEDRIRSIYGDRVFIVPYIMPGFILAREIKRLTRDLDWNEVEALILMNHGVFTFDNDARKSYDRMISVVSEAEQYLERQDAILQHDKPANPWSSRELAQLRRTVSQARGKAVLAIPDTSPESTTYSLLDELEQISQRGPLTPDHIIRTKQCPMLLLEDIEPSVASYVSNYKAYFGRNENKGLTCLEPSPRWAVIPGNGSVCFGRNLKEARIIRDISHHTMKTIRQAEIMESWQALPEKDLFEMEYWVLEQAKLAKGGTEPPLQGKVALVTGAASGIGKACVDELTRQGAVVAAWDLKTFETESAAVCSMAVDVTDREAIQKGIDRIIQTFGGLDLVISNAGTFPPSHTIAEMDEQVWQRSLDVNLSSHRMILTAAHPYLALGIEPAVVIIGSKNVPAPGKGAGAYSVAKAGLTQLTRVAALEMGIDGIRVNIIHPNAVYDTAIWTEEVLEARAKHYGLTVEAYKTNNVLRTEVASVDVAALAVSMCTNLFDKTTGAQLPIDGGNDRVI